MRRENALRMADELLAYMRALSRQGVEDLIRGDEIRRAELVALLMKLGKRKPDGEPK